MSILAESLIYTNVEVEQSPTKQRGFQVWQVSEGLQATHKKEITKRVDDYLLPIGTSYEIAQEWFIRDAFFPLSEGYFGFARTFPLREPDKFKRGGRFFSHVYVIRQEDFINTGSDPFAWFDGLSFLQHPSLIEEPRLGRLPVANVAPKVASKEPSSRFAPELIATIVGHLDRELSKQKTIVVVGKPIEIAKKLQPIYEALPPQLRRAYAFDTFSLGSGLTNAPCAFVGCPSAEALRLWAYRRFVKLDLVTGIFTPAADPPLQPLYVTLTSHAAWHTASDRVREQAWEALRLVKDQNFTELIQVFEEDSEVEQLLEQLPDYHAALETAKLNWIARCPKLLQRLPEVQTFLRSQTAGSPRELLTRMSKPISVPALAEAVADAVLRGHKFSDAEQAELRTWLQSSDGAERLHYLLDRMQYQRLPELMEFVERGDATSEPIAEWIRAQFTQDRVSISTLLDALGPSGTPDSATLFDARLYQAVYDCSEQAASLNFRLAYHDGQDKFKDYLSSASQVPAAESSAFLAKRIHYGWHYLMDLSFGLFVGGYFYPQTDCDHLLMNVLQQECSPRPGKKLLRKFLPALASASQAPRFGGNVLSPGAEVLMKEILTLKANPSGSERGERLRETLSQSSLHLFLELFSLIRGRFISESYFTEPGPNSVSFAFGYKITLIDPNSRKGNIDRLLELLLSAAAQQLNPEVPPARPATEPSDRFLEILIQFS